MAEAPFRDADPSADRWRDKIELKLDNRQVFFLFFGSAVVACMLFVLGVMVGKRIESRGQAEAPALQDPLAALDRARQPAAGAAAAAVDQELAFPSTLITAPKAKPATLKPAAPKPLAPPKPVAIVAPPPKAPLVPAPAAPKPLTPAVAVTKPLPAVIAAPKPVAPPAATKPATPVAPVKGKFTLQLSTFGTAESAKEFAEKYPGAFVIAGEVPGKGMAYRVRYGNFGSFKDAAAAKESFEREHNMIALVAAR
jgi:hypothetical protein